MRFIKISEDILVNPEEISCLEYRWTEFGKELFVMVDGKEYKATIPPSVLLQDLSSAGVEYDEKIWQFWAG